MDAPKNVYLDHDGNLQGITQRELVDDLVGRMKKMDWYFTYSDDASVRNRGAEELGKIERGLKLLAFSNGGGAQAGQLWEKHTPKDFAMSRYLFRAALIEQQQLVNGDPNPVATLIKSLQERLNKPEMTSGNERFATSRELESDLYRLAEYRGRELQAVRLYHSSTYGADNPLPDFFKNYQQLLPMNEKILDHAEGQLKRVGMQESFTPALKEAMLRGDALIRHTYPKEYERELTKNGKKETVRDTLNIEQYWKKSPTTDKYFLNKFDAALLKAGKNEPVKQTFYLSERPGMKETAGVPANTPDNRQPTRYTLKESYNLLAGRPVQKELTNNKGEPFKAWVQLDLQNKLPNGNYKMNSYHQNYGFKLEETLRQYPIKDLLNPEFKQRLTESLERGNLQKVNFIGKNKKSEFVLITPSITTGSLKLYALDGKPISLDTQVQKEWVTNDFAKALKVRFENRNKQTSKQEGTKQKQSLGQRLTKMLRRGA